jgi:hypothetical protein
VGTAENLCTEVFDQIPNRANPMFITWKDFKTSKNAGAVVVLMTDPGGFVTEDTRESVLQQKATEAQHEEMDIINEMI